MKTIGDWALALGAFGLLAGACGGSAAGAGGSTAGASTAGAATAGDSTGGGSGAAAGGVDTAGGVGVGCSALPVPLEQFPEQLAAVLCDGVAPCCSAADVPYAEASCKSSAKQAALQLLPGSDSPNRVYDPAGAARCLCAIEHELASCQDFDHVVETACQGISVGTLSTGSECSRSSDCTPPGYCKVDPTNADSRTCSDDGGSNYPRAKEGEACIGGCDLESDQPVCSAIGPMPSGSYCYRADDLYCAFDSKLCTKLGMIGELCVPFDNGCASGEYCSAAGLCAAQTDSGQCSDGGSDACSADSYCADGQCQGPRKADGETCLQSAECIGKICIGSDAENAGRCGRETAASGHRCEGGLK